MIWMVLAVLGVPIWLVVGRLAGALWSRRSFRRAPGVFACKVNSVSGADGSAKWERGTAYARWVHDVLLVHRGLALMRFEALPVRIVEQAIKTIQGVKVKVETRSRSDSAWTTAPWSRSLPRAPRPPSFQGRSSRRGRCR